MTLWGGEAILVVTGTISLPVSWSCRDPLEQSSAKPSRELAACDFKQRSAKQYQGENELRLE